MKKISFLKKIAAVAFAAVSMSACAFAADLVDIEGHWSKDYVTYGVENGYINGYPEDNTFKPDKPVTRAEFSKMINSAMGISGKEEISFFDVEDNMWYYPEVQKAVFAGYVTGYEDGSFRATNLITRQEAAVILSRISSRADGVASIDSFGDSASVASWAKSALEFACAKGYFSGDDLGNLNPTASLTRGQAAKLLYTLKNVENIYNGLYTITMDEAVCSETVFTDDVYFSAVSENAVLSIDGCKILGTLYIQTMNESYVTVEDSAVNKLVINGAHAEVELKNGSTVKNTEIKVPALISGEGFKNVILTGGNLTSGTTEILANPERVGVQSDALVKAAKLGALHIDKPASVTVQDGNIENMKVEKDASGSVITLASGVSVENLTVNAPAAFMGTGKIENAVNNSTGVSFATEPGKLTGTKPEDDTSAKDDDKDDEPAGGYVPTSVAPSKGETKVSVSAYFLAKFPEALLDSEGDPVTSAYLEKHIELRERSASGTKVDYDAYMSDTNRFYVYPRKELDHGTKYYVIIPEGIFTNKAGEENPKLTYYFTTRSSTDDDDYDGPSSNTSNSITFSPKNAANDVESSDTIKITFSSAIRRSNGDELTSSYLSKNAVELREKSTSGAKVDIIATLNSTKKIITIEPQEALKPDTRYYIVIVSGTMEYSSGTNIGKTSSYFTTTDELDVTVTPGNAETLVPVDTEITLEFNSAIYRPSGSNVTSSYLAEDAIQLRKKSATGEKVDFTAVLSSDRKTVTIIPSELEPGIRYYIVIPSGVLANEDENENSKMSYYFTTAAAMAPSIKPANKEDGVDPAAPVVIKFSEALYDKEGEPITEEYIAEKVVTLRKNSSSGTKLDFDVEISSDYKTITITPAKTFSSNATYYVAVAKSTLYNENKKANTAATSTFYTASSSKPDFLPYDGEEDVDVETKIEITFESKMYQIGGTDLTTTYIKNNVIELYKDSYDGEAQSFSVKLSSDKQTITITPSKDLEGNSKYVVVIRKSSMEDADGDENIFYSSSFTTAEAIVTGCEITPINKEKNVPVNTEIEVAFNSSVYRTNGNIASEAYILNNAIELREKSKTGTKIACEAEISNDNKTITLIPENDLKANTTYYVNVVANMLVYSDSTKVAAKSIYFTTGEAKISDPVELSVDGIGETSANVTVSVLLDGSLDISYKNLKTNKVTDRVTGLAVAKDSEREFALTGLESGVEYEVTVTFTDGEDDVTTKTETFTTLEPEEENLEITGITVTDSNRDVYTPDIENGVAEITTVSSATYIKIAVASSVANAEVTVNGGAAIKPGANSVNIEVTAGDTVEIPVVLTSKDTGDFVECTVKVTVHE